MRRIGIGDAELEAVALGSGDPVVLVPTALTADESLPLGERLRGAFRLLHYRRRGYGGSSSATAPGSVARDAADCARLMAALAVDRAHIVGVSYSAAVALQLAVDHPEAVHTLTLVEPPPLHGRGDAAFRAAAGELLADRRDRGAAAAADRFLTTSMGPDWRTRLDDAVPGSAGRVLPDAATFFDVDIPALLDWPFDADSAARVRCPVVHVAGGAHGALFADVGDLISSWLPHAEQATVADAGHEVALTHPDALAGVLMPFLTRHAVQ